MDVAFDAVHEDIRILGTVLQALSNELSGNISLLPAAGRTAHYICQQCEASLQFLLSLCQQKLFQDRVLRNKVVYSMRCICLRNTLYFNINHYLLRKLHVRILNANNIQLDN